MKKLLLASAALVAFSSASFAADLPSRKGAPVAPVVYVPAFSWTGFYVGLQGGYQWGRSAGTLTDAVGPLGYGYNPKGGVFGAHVGYNYQFGGGFVAGLEGDVEWSGMKASSLSATGAYYHRTDIDWQGSVRGRLGFAFDRALIYGTGGVAFANLKRSAGIPGGAQLLSYSETRAGWTLGAGLEYALTNNITMRGEYRYADYGRSGGSNAVIADRGKVTTHTVRAGVSYKF